MGMGGMGNNPNRNGNCPYSHGNKFTLTALTVHKHAYFGIYVSTLQAKKPRLDDFSGLCDLEDMGWHRNELAGVLAGKSCNATTTI